MRTEFDRVLPWLKAALEADDPRPLWTPDGVREELEADRAHLWTGPQSCVVTTVSEWETGERVFEAWLAGGEMSEVLGMIAPLEQHARVLGCTQAQVIGRRGWVRAMAPYGYTHYATTVRKLLT